MSVPEGWQNINLGNVITYKKGFAFNSASYQTSGTRIIRISDTTRNSVNSDNPVFVSSEQTSGLNGYILTEGEIVLSTVGSRPHLLDSMVGKAVRIPKDVEGSLLNQNLVKLIPKESLITNDYLYEIVKKNRFIYFISTLVRGNANQVSITLAELFKYKFLLPPLPEQKKIARILSTWDRAIEVTEKLLKNSQQQKKALMQQLLTGKKRLPGFSGEWKKMKVSQIGNVVTGNTPPKSEPENYGKEYSWATAEDFQSKYVQNTAVKLTSLGAKKSRLVPKGAVLVTCIASIGKNAIAGEELATNQQINAVVVSTEHNNEFFYYLIEFFNHKLVAWAGVTAVPILNKSSFEKIKFDIPSLEEQQKIASVLSAADKEIELLEQKLDCLRQEKKALMQQLLTGRRRVKGEAA